MGKVDGFLEIFIFFIFLGQFEIINARGRISFVGFIFHVSYEDSATLRETFGVLEVYSLDTLQLDWAADGNLQITITFFPI